MRIPCASYPGLPSLSLQDTEKDALVFYGPCAGSVAALGAYWVPKQVSGNWVWVVNPLNPRAVGYANSVLSQLR